MAFDIYNIVQWVSLYLTLVLFLAWLLLGVYLYANHLLQADAYLFADWFRVKQTGFSSVIHFCPVFLKLIDLVAHWPLFVVINLSFTVMAFFI